MTNDLKNLSSSSGQLQTVNNKQNAENDSANGSRFSGP